MRLCPIWILNKTDDAVMGRSAEMAPEAQKSKNAHVEIARDESTSEEEMDESDSRPPLKSMKKKKKKITKHTAMLDIKGKKVAATY